MRNLAILTLVATGLFAQTERLGTITYGFKIGSPINSPSSDSFFQSTYTQSRWTGGPTIELHLPYRFAIEFDTLYWNSQTRQNITAGFGGILNPVSTNIFEKNNSWDLPVLGKYRFKIGAFRPFVSAGWLFTHESIERTVVSQCLGPQGSCAPTESPYPVDNASYREESRWRSGPAGGVGLEFKTRYVTITPELRFSRLINTYPRDNRFTGMVGFTFGGKQR